MAKTYEQLTQDAQEEDFENMAEQITEQDRELVRKAAKIKKLDEVRPQKFISSILSELSREELEGKLEARGDVEYIVTEGNIDEMLKAEKELVDENEHDMWSTAAEDFGDPLKFIGNPFDRSKELQKELVVCMKQAEEIMKDYESEVIRVEEAISITSETN